MILSIKTNKNLYIQTKSILITYILNSYITEEMIEMIQDRQAQQAQQNWQLRLPNQTSFNSIWQTIQNKNRLGDILTYYLPCYMRIKLKNIKEMELAELKAEVNATLLLTIYYGPLPSGIVKQIKNNLILFFDRNEALSLKDTQNKQVTVKQNKQKRELAFTIRRFFQLRIEGDVRFSPFEVIYMILSIKIQSIIVNWKNNLMIKQLELVPDKVQIKFNLMDVVDEDVNVKISYNDGIVFGYYDLAENLRKVQFTDNKYPQLVMDKQNIKIDPQSRAQNHFQYAHFIIPMYKYPGVTLLTIFVPIQFLAVVNFAIFFQQFGLADRIACIATLMIAYLAMIPIIRAELTKTPIITLIQVLVYLEVSATLLCLIESIIGRARDQETDVFDWYSSPLFLIALVVTVLCTLIVLIFYAIHCFILQGRYNSTNEKEKEGKFEAIKWNKYDKIYANEECSSLQHWLKEHNKKLFSEGRKPKFIDYGTKQFIKTETINVATLNFSAILNSPFEFYSIGDHYMTEMQLSRRFKINMAHKQILQQLEGGMLSQSNLQEWKKKIDIKDFSWQIGDIDKNQTYQLKRYSPLYCKDVGLEKGVLITKQEFYKKWEEKWKQIYQDDGKIQPPQIRRAKIFDFVCYQSLVQVFCSSVAKNFNKIIQNQEKSPDIYKAKMEAFFQKQFLKTDRKFQMLKQNGIQDQMIDVIFLQEADQSLQISINQDDYKIIKGNEGQSKQCAIVLRRQAFDRDKMKTEYYEVIKQLNDKGITEEDLKWKLNKDGKANIKAAIALIDDVLFMSAHLSSGKAQNETEKKRVYQCLQKLKKKSIKFIVGITSNSQIDPPKPLRYQFFPQKLQQSYTIKKTRTAMQAQYKKADQPTISCSDFILSSQKMDNQKICTILGDSYKKIPYLPSNDHPFDHFMVFCAVKRK